ncbi:MAG: cytochrome c-type biogenesis protein CcmH [Pseudomonadota bacterium]|nr:cytochrome c-type biogenesis protein CcmH [Pseudomonadota bacterium]MDE3037652.1 cytochrome c-type biogenesis protein CcmH [Pseudomonadota bacterium]
MAILNRWLAVGFLLLAGQAFALVVETPLADGAQEARARALFHQIRCVVCEGQAIADSPADVASDMRRLIRDRIASGDSDAAIKAYLVSRYGDFILMQPPLKADTWILWFGPILVLLAGGGLAWKSCGARSAHAGHAERVPVQSLRDSQDNV